MNMDDKKLLPVAPLRDFPMFPNTETVLLFGRNRSVNALKAAWEGSKEILVVLQKDKDKVEPSVQDLYQVGVICQVKHVMHTDGETSALVSGKKRVVVLAYQNFDTFMVAQVVDKPEVYNPEDANTVALAHHIASEIQNLVRMGKPFDFLVMMRVMSGVAALELSNIICPMLDLTPDEKQMLLETDDIFARLEKISLYLAQEIKEVEVEMDIFSKAKGKIDKNYREHILQEKKKAIEEELGEVGDGDEKTEVKELSERIAKAGMPEFVRKKADKELKKFEKMSNMNPEKGWARNYLEWLLDMPWSKMSPNNADIKKAEEILNEDHFGLDKIKERILEHLSVLKLQHLEDKPSSTENEEVAAESSAKTELPGSKLLKKKNHTPTILCFVGPPGVGKTSIGKSIAKALGREFVRISLGGVKDEAEIRGHRRTYVGALPGQIIQGMKQAGTGNPVFMLDEIDKLGADFRGDPSAALLEALDPEQNTEFTDHYLDVPFDLSQVLFITTANLLDTIPSALLDRLEVIEFPGYTTEEKFHIAQKYLWPKQRDVNGLIGKEIEISEEALKTIISRYTHEAGVRNLEREIARIMRKVAKKIAQGEQIDKLVVNAGDIHGYLGPFKFTSTIAERRNEIGMSTGLFWSAAGGGIHLIEVALMPGKGNLILTGQLGDVMQESAKAAMTYVRSHWKDLKISEKIFAKTDVHVHVPEGARKKDGPSAGAAMTTAITSAFTRKPTDRYTAMTGEVTLRGRVLEIGGVKEKIIGAHLAGIKKIIMPKENEKDLEEIPQYVLKNLEFIFVERVEEVLKHVLVKK